MLENPRSGQGDSLAEFHREERHTHDRQSDVERPVSRAGFVFLPLHVARSMIADFTAASVAPDDLHKGFGRTGRSSAQKVGYWIFPFLLHLPRRHRSAR